VVCSKEAFNMLANELLGFIRRQYTGSMDVSADSMGDDVYTWSVEMWKSAFKPDCQLAKVRLLTHSTYSRAEEELSALALGCCFIILCWALFTALGF
jgi:hypothetical protein